jgi:GT2 family glycosyltransferase
LLLPIAALKRTAPPDQSFVVYSDDHDYSLRLMDAGVQLYLTDVGCINDAEESWDNKPTSARSALISSTSPKWRIYYAARNRMLIEQRYVTMPIVYHLNRRSYLAILALQALLQHRSFAGMRAAMRPLLRGISDGDDRRLGVHANYPLPSWSTAPTVHTPRESFGNAQPRMDLSGGV